MIYNIAIFKKIFLPIHLLWRYSIFYLMQYLVSLHFEAIVFYQNLFITQRAT